MYAIRSYYGLRGGGLRDELLGALADAHREQPVPLRLRPEGGGGARGGGEAGEIV